MGNGILKTWYDFESELSIDSVKKSKSQFIMERFPKHIREMLFPENRCRRVTDIIDNDTFDIRNKNRGDDSSEEKSKEKNESGIVKAVREISSQIKKGDEGTFRQDEIAYLNKRVGTYGDKWYGLAERLANVFDDESGRYTVETSTAMSNFFDTITNDEDGKRLLALGLYNCICIMFIGSSDPIAEWDANDKENREQYLEYTEIFKKHGRYSYQSNLLIKKYADAGNRYAMFDLAQMYYYGEGIATEKRYDKTLAIYNKLKEDGWKYPLFLWARADFIIEYFDSRNREEGTFYNICLPELDTQPRHDLYVSLMNDLIDAEAKGCGSAANLCGNILSGKALLKGNDDDDNTNYEVLHRILKNRGDRFKHYQRGARSGNTYSFYHLYTIFMDEFLLEFDVKKAIDSFKKAIEFLKSSAETENPRARNELALVYIMGEKKYALKKLDDHIDDHLPEVDGKRAEIEDSYGNDTTINLVEAFYQLEGIYETSIEKSDFKWPVYNMIKHVYLNPGFTRLCRFDYSDENKKERERMISKASDMEQMIEDLDKALATLKDKESNNGVRCALESVHAELEKRLQEK